MTRDRFTAKHEAAHIVVGVACGLRMRRAVLAKRPLENGWLELGHVLFAGNTEGQQREALALMYAAGVAWEGGGAAASIDRELLRACCSGRLAERALIRAADAMLCTRGAILERVAEALTHRDLNGRDITAIARGERID